MENEQGRLVNTWEMLYKDANGEGHIETLHKYDHTTPAEIPDFISQAPAMRITPSRRVRPETDYLERVATIGDIHFPFQDEQRLALAEIALQEIQPTRIDLLGDNLDNPNYSRFETRKEWAESTQRGIDEYAEFLGRLVANHPDADIVWHEGNHDQRIEKRIRDFNEDILGIKPAGEKLESLSLEFLLQLGSLGVRMSKGYPSAREVVHNQLEIYHGDVTNSTGLAASKVIQQAFMSFNTGHTHNLGIVAKTVYMGDERKTIYGAESGTFANPDITPSGKYAPGTMSRLNWQSGIIDWIVDESGAVPTLHPIDENGLRIGDKRWKT
jgi:hypothetical protein